MALTVTQRTLTAAQKIQKTPVLVLEIDGLGTKYGSATVFELIRVGDPDLLIGNDWRIGGMRALTDQSELVEFSDSTNTIRQTLDIDKGRGSTISSMEIGLVDLNDEATRLISPGLVLEDILGRKCRVYLGFDGVPYSEFNIVFRGNVDDIKSTPGLVKLNIAHPDNKKRQLIAPKTETKITAGINNLQTTGIILENADDLILPTADPNFRTYVRINNELIQYTGITVGNELTGVSRGAIGTIANSHPINQDLTSFYRLNGTAMDIALKIMLSSVDEYWVSDVEVTNFVYLPDGSSVDNAIYFDGLDVEDYYGVSVGDFCTVTLATDVSNDFTLRTIVGIEKTDLGSYLVVDGSPLILETDSPALIKFKTQYNTLPELMGLGMAPDEVDVKEHQRVQQLFLSSFEYDFYLDDTIDNAQDWIESEVYKPSSSFSLPRRAKSSVGYLTQPIPSGETLTISADDIVKPQNMTLRRTTAKAFFNHIVYSYERDTLEAKFLRGIIDRSATSTDRIKVGAKPLVIKSLGMRDSLNAANLAHIASGRRLKRYEFGAEMFESVELTFGKGFRIEIGDTILFDHGGLAISNTVDGTRVKPAKLYSVENKTMNLKTGSIQLSLTDTNYATQARYCLFGPASRIKKGISTTQFIIEPINADQQNFGINEYQRWSRFQFVAIKIRSPDFTTHFAQTIITGIAGNTITVRDPLGFVPTDGVDIMELANYDFVDTTDQIKLLYCFMQDAATFPSDGAAQYQML